MRFIGYIPKRQITKFMKGGEYCWKKCWDWDMEIFGDEEELRDIMCGGHIGKYKITIEEIKDK